MLDVIPWWYFNGVSWDQFESLHNDITVESDLDRIDSRFSFKATLLIADELDLMKKLLGEMDIDEDPMTFGKCVARTDF